MNRLLLSVLLFLNSAFCWGKDFRFHILSDPATLDPLKSAGSWNSFIHYNIYRAFYVYQEGRLQPQLVKRCTYTTPLSLTCELRDDLKYSNGESIAPEDFIRSFHAVFKPSSTTRAKSELLALKNAKQILAGKKSITELGVALDTNKKNTIVFNFEEKDVDFLNRLSSPIFTPRPDPARLKGPHPDRLLAEQFATGPYRLKKLSPLKSVELENNTAFDKKNRPPVTVLIVNNDSTAFNLYKKNELNFLRRVPQDQYNFATKNPKLKKEIHIQPQLRMDHLGFSGLLSNEPDLREALLHSLDYEILAKLLNARSRPGCVSLLASYYEGKPLCYDFDLKRAQAALEKVNPDIKNQPLNFYFSIQGGEDILRAVEWFQNQWKKNLGLDIRLHPTENTQLTALLKKDPPDIFRRGVPVDAPSCFSAFETFQKNHPDNFLKLNDPAFIKSVDALNVPTLSQQETARRCRSSLEKLLATKRLIPLGEIHFFILSRPQFKGWSLNELNQLDLSNLRSAQ